MYKNRLTGDHLQARTENNDNNSTASQLKNIT